MSKPTNFYAGDRIRVSDESPWAKSALGVIRENPNPGNYNKEWKGCPKVEIDRFGPIFFYWVCFDTPQKHPNGTEMRVAGEIEARFLLKVDKDSEPVSGQLPNDQPEADGGAGRDGSAPGKRRHARMLPVPDFEQMIEAGMIDLAVYLAVTIGFIGVVRLSDQVSLVGVTPIEIIPLAFAILLSVWFYQCFFVFAFGQTLGKMAAKIKVVDNSNHRPNLAKSALRASGHVLCLLTAGVGFLFVMFGLSLPDRIAGTKQVFLLLD